MEKIGGMLSSIFEQRWHQQHACFLFYGRQAGLSDMREETGANGSRNLWKDGIWSAFWYQGGDKAPIYSFCLVAGVPV
jgi:hypothetical protein